MRDNIGRYGWGKLLQSELANFLGKWSNASPWAMVGGPLMSEPILIAAMIETCRTWSRSYQSTPMEMILNVMKLSLLKSSAIAINGISKPPDSLQNKWIRPRSRYTTATLSFTDFSHNLELHTPENINPLSSGHIRCAPSIQILR